MTIAIYFADPVLRCSLEQLLREDPAMTVVGVADNPSAMLRLIEQNHVDAVLADSPPHEQLADWRTRHGEIAFVVLVDGYNDEDGLEASTCSICSAHVYYWWLRVRHRLLEWSVCIFPLIARRYECQNIPMFDYLSVLNPKQIVEHGGSGRQISLR
jgi:hypothetical protein